MIDLSKIMRYAIQSHMDQAYGDYPYVTHLSDVYGVALEFGIQDQVILAGTWLHDILEDRDKNYNDIKKLGGLVLAEVVYAVTDEKGRNRQERHEKTWPGVREVDRAVILKQLDMIANMRRGGKIDMYRKEYPEFRKFFEGKGMPELWKELDKLAGWND